MKIKLFILLFICFFKFFGHAQSGNKIGTDNIYAIIQVISPPTVFGEYEIKISYGNGEVENFKTIEFSRKNKDELVNEITNALNYLSKKGYMLRQTLMYTTLQYIFEKK